MILDVSSYRLQGDILHVDNLPQDLDEEVSINEVTSPSHKRTYVISSGSPCRKSSRNSDWSPLVTQCEGYGCSGGEA